MALMMAGIAGIGGKQTRGNWREHALGNAVDVEHYFSGR